MPMTSFMRNDSGAGTGRVAVAVAACCVQLALGAVYGWSVFLNPVRELFSASKPEANLTFTITLAVLGITRITLRTLLRRYGLLGEAETEPAQLVEG